MANVEWTIHTFAELPSTQLYACELAEQENMPEGTVIQALTQTNGRGRHGGDWFSPMGNLHMSFILRPDCKPAEAPQMSFVMAVALWRAISHYMAKDDHERMTLKWPNDVMIDGRKCAGILIETAGQGSAANIDALVVGVGVDILSAPQEGIALVTASEARLAVHPFRDQVLAETKVLYKQWLEEGFAPIREEWLAHAYALDEEIEFQSGNETLTGVYKGIDETGALRLEGRDKTSALHAGRMLRK